MTLEKEWNNKHDDKWNESKQGLRQRIEKIGKHFDWKGYRKECTCMMCQVLTELSKTYAEIENISGRLDEGMNIKLHIIRDTFISKSKVLSALDTQDGPESKRRKK